MINYIFSIVVIFVISVVNGFPDRFVTESDYPFKLYKREDWGAVPQSDVVPLNTPVPYVIIHHTYIPAACNTTEECKKSMRSMQKYHAIAWDGAILDIRLTQASVQVMDILNFCIGSESGVYEGRGWETKGIHAGRANGVSVGICLIGDWRTELPPQGQLDATKALIRAGVKEGHIRSDYKLVGHKQVMATECPGGALYQEIFTWDHFVPEFEELKN